MSTADRADALYKRALALRADNRRDEALDLLGRANAASRANAAIVHAIAQVRLEAGLPAASAFASAIALTPGDPALRLGRAASLHAEGDSSRALEELAAVLRANPGWGEGHLSFARLSGMASGPQTWDETVRAAVDRAPDSPGLIMIAIDLALNVGDYAAVIEWADRGFERFGVAPAWDEAKAIAWDELGETRAASGAFATLGEPDTMERAVRLVRHRLRAGDPEAAMMLVDRWLTEPGAELIWPYAATVWRMLDPARAKWLDLSGSLIAVIDSGQGPDELAELVSCLNKLHSKAGRFPDQSVRGGSQTDGALLARLESPIVKLRERFRESVREYVSRLPESDPTHPTLGMKREPPVRFAGSWSVRLTGSGQHVAHHHPQGWISSAFYASVPNNLPAGKGALALGAPPADLGLGLPAEQTIDPKPGQLVLFPSWMWHETTPFSEGERITVAFDVARS